LDWTGLEVWRVGVEWEIVGLKANKKKFVRGNREKVKFTFYATNDGMGKKLGWGLGEGEGGVRAGWGLGRTAGFWMRAKCHLVGETI
jgi:hypothetical protein